VVALEERESEIGAAERQASGLGMASVGMAFGNQSRIAESRVLLGVPRSWVGLVVVAMATRQAVRVHEGS